MKRSLLFLVVVCLMLATAPVATIADSSITADDNATIILETSDYVHNELIVITDTLFDSSDCNGKLAFDFYGVPTVNVRSLFGMTKDDIIGWEAVTTNIYPYLVTLSNEIDASSALQILNNKEGIVKANFNYVLRNETDEIENIAETDDLMTSEEQEQWSHEYLQMSSVWGKSFVGSDDIKIGVLDGGYTEHTDLEDNLDMSLAYNSYYENQNINTTNHHGNFVVGIIGADYNDGGINGVCKNVTIIPIKDDSSSINFTSSVIEGANYAIRNGAKIINCSQKLKEDMSALILILENAQVLFVTSAGNEGLNMQNSEDGAGKVNDSPYWIVVGSINSLEEKASWSNYSSEYVDLFAPGVSVRSTTLDAHTTASGTSYAAPHVAAACALLMSKATHKTPLQIKQLLMNNVKTLSGFEQYCVSGGALSINNAVDALYAENRGAYTKGDVNGDGYIDQLDYIACRRIYFETLTPTDDQFEAADVDGNGIVDTFDVNMINRYYFRTLYFAP